MDRTVIAARIALRRQQIAYIEDRLVSACERAAGHGRPGRRPPEDRDEWDRGTWDRYLREAYTQEHEVGPQLRRLHREITQLERLSALPVPPTPPCSWRRTTAPSGADERGDPERRKREEGRRRSERREGRRSAEPEEGEMCRPTARVGRAPRVAAV